MKRAVSPLLRRLASFGFCSKGDTKAWLGDTVLLLVLASLLFTTNAQAEADRYR